jgi:hypothetical protein
MKHSKYNVWCGILAALVTLGSTNSPAAPHRTQNVFLIISDGLRWQEVFNGAEAELMNATNGGVKHPEALRAEFSKDTPEAQRQALFPFLWNNIARQGQIFGNQAKDSVVSVSNGKKFSYPGYNEILTGWGDPRIDSNDKKPNPNETIFEWLNRQPGFQGRVSILGTWDVFPYIFNIERSGLPIWPAWEPRFENKRIKVSDTVADLLRDTTPLWEDLAYDSLLLHAAQDHIKRQQPRVVFIGFGETDEWAHEGRYDHYLHAAHRMDDFVRRLWETVQALSQYRDKTTFILTADHGRGSGPAGWRNHGEKVEGAEGDWIAIMGPDTPALGERTNLAPISENQIAATIAALLGKDFRRDHPQSGLTIQDAFGQSR